MAVLTVRMTDKEKAALARRARAAGVSASGLVRQLIDEPVFNTASDLLKEMERRTGDKRLRNRGRK